MSLRVRFDERIFLGQRRGGVSRYFAELARAFGADDALGVRLLPARTPVANEHAVEAAPDVFTPSVPARELGRRLQARLLPRRAYVPPRGGTRPDLLHYTYYETDWLVPDLPTVSTIHDMIHELLPDQFPPSPRGWSKRAFVERSSGVICVSETTRSDLVRLFGDPGTPLAVIPLGVGDAFRAPAPPRLRLPGRYLLFVGQRGAYKNFTLALDAFAALRRSRPDLELVCVGGLAWSDAERAALAAHGVGTAVHRLDVPDSDLPGVYARAAALVFPSSHEGFGLPVLEAMAAGTPVVVADTAIAHEVAGGAAAVAATSSAEAFAAALEPLLDDAVARARAVADGRARVAGFTWARTARATADFYRQVLDA